DADADAAERDLDLPTGRLVTEPAGGGATPVIAVLPPGGYRARVAVRRGKGPTATGERYFLTLWRRPQGLL
ncbi:MAG TPA: hypothetical protein VF533_13085, partial [Solirubrobacteraceae bacterium]